MRLGGISGLLLLVVTLTQGAHAAPVKRVSVRDSAGFTIVSPPPVPLDVHESAVRLTAGSHKSATTGVYKHAGAEYGIVVLGALSRWDEGRTRLVRAGDTFFSPPGASASNSVSRASVQVSAFLQPRGKPPRGLTRAIFGNSFHVSEVPRTPFTFVEQLVDIQPGGSTIRFSYGGQAFFTVANGELVLEKNGHFARYRLGESFSALPSDTVRFANAGKRLASVFLVVLLPEATRLTHPHRAY